MEGPDELGHFKGACSDRCRRCAIEQSIEQSAGLLLVGATGACVRARFTCGTWWDGVWPNVCVWQPSRTSCKMMYPTPSAR